MIILPQDYTMTPAILNNLTLCGAWGKSQIRALKDTDSGEKGYGLG